MSNPSEVSGCCDTDRNNKSCMEDITNLESSDELDLCEMDDGQLLSIINSESPVKVVSLLKVLNSSIQEGLSNSLISKSFTQNGLNQALISACRLGHKHLVQTLVRVGANIEHPDENGNTPLLICAENGFTDIVRFLVSRHANVRAFNSVGNTALILSIRPAGSTDLTRFLLEQQDVDIHYQNQHGDTALHRATHFMDVDTMRLLLQKSMKRNTDTGYLSYNEFTYETDSCFTIIRSDNIKQEVIAARAGLSDVSKILKQHVITGTSPLELAIKAGDITSLDIFLDCQFSSSSDKKRYVDSALMYMFTNSRQSNSLKFSLTEKKIIQRLLENEADVNQGHGSILLSRAVELGDFQLVELLCTHGACVTTHSYSREQDPLCIAAKAGRRDLIELLLQYQADINRGGFSNSPLDFALRNNHIECAKLLIQHGAKMDDRRTLSSAVDHQATDFMDFLFYYKPDIMNHFLQSPHIARELLISAVEKGNCEIIGQILDAGVGVNDMDSRAQTPLKASTSGEVVQFLIQRGADVNQATTGRNGIETPLMHMIHHRKCADTSTIDLCQVLIDNGASVNCRNGEGKTSLMMAASHGECESMLQMLIDKGADVNDKDNNGDTPLHHAVMEQYSKNVCCLITSARDKKIVIDVHNNEGLTPLMVSAKKGNIRIMQALIEAGADVNMKDNQENTALHHLLIAHSLYNEKMLECLLKAGSDVNCQNSDGLSPLMLAARMSMTPVVTSLLDAGADANAVSKNNHSQTALSFLSDMEYFQDDTILCIETLLAKGARSSYLNNEYLHKLIIENKINIIIKLIQSGVGPTDVEANIMAWRRVTSNIPSTVSPLCVTLLHGQIRLARYFVDILFLTSSDLSMFACNTAMECLLKQEDQEESLNFLQELSSQPMSLVQLSLVAVSSAVGPFPGRETRVDSLPLPQMMKDRLLFK